MEPPPSPPPIYQSRNNSVRSRAEQVNVSYINASQRHLTTHTETVEDSTALSQNDHAVKKVTSFYSHHNNDTLSSNYDSVVALDETTANQVVLVDAVIHHRADDIEEIHSNS